MSQPIYKLYLGKMKEAWHQLPHKAKNDLPGKVNGALAQAGGKQVLMCKSKLVQ